MQEVEESSPAGPSDWLQTTNNTHLGEGSCNPGGSGENAALCLTRSLRFIADEDGHRCVSARPEQGFLSPKKDGKKKCGDVEENWCHV
ncbi:hypothetical protein DNTS_024884 [Danionella cerebrum]|uniref:Uncharacterized protein n=1 Tax=Danionella cerebrum TaxID=2873325 RepID=A0A553QST4_9TELE|nr:hypothetical protein DNTS_024884 [Danionella translucida]